MHFKSSAPDLKKLRSVCREKMAQWKSSAPDFEKLAGGCRQIVEFLKFI
jgi:hypothetical protein